MQGLAGYRVQVRAGKQRTVLQRGRRAVNLGVLVPHDEHRYAGTVLACVPDLLSLVMVYSGTAEVLRTCSAVKSFGLRPLTKVVR